MSTEQKQAGRKRKQWPRWRVEINGALDAAIRAAGDGRIDGLVLRGLIERGLDAEQTRAVAQEAFAAAERMLHEARALLQETRDTMRAFREALGDAAAETTP